VILDSKISPKEVRLVAKEDGYVIEDEVDEETKNRPCLTEKQAVALASYAKALEAHFGCPQDIEWAIDEKNEPLLLQTRPLRLERNERGKSPPRAEPVSGYSLVLEGGEIVCPGVGSGVAHIVRSVEDLMTFPEGGVLVAANPLPSTSS
jgi:pyruvate,water dikinase